jgi:hypothetical protein
MAFTFETRYSMEIVRAKKIHPAEVDSFGNHPEAGPGTTASHQIAKVATRSL